MRLLAGVLLLASTLTGSTDPAAVVDAWKTSPVYVDPTQRSLVPEEDAAELAERVRGHDPAIRIAVVPAAVLNDGHDNNSNNSAAARKYVDKLVDAQRTDGIYLVVFGGAISWGSAVGVDTPIAEILTDELGKHSRSDPVGTLNGVLDQLDVPKASKGTPGWLWPLLIVLVLLIAGGLALRWWKSRPDGAPALYRPSYDVLPDEVDTVAERRAAAREDVTRFGEELDAADVRLDGVDTAADVQAAMDAYAEAGRVVDGEPDDDKLREVRATVEYGRWRLACAQAKVAGTPAPARRAACFFDPGHGTSVTDWMYTPPGGRPREVPVCAACRDRLSGGAR